MLVDRKAVAKGRFRLFVPASDAVQVTDIVEALGQVEPELGVCGVFGNELLANRQSIGVDRLRFVESAPVEAHFLLAFHPNATAYARRFFGVDGDQVTLVREIHDELRWNERRSVPAGPPVDPHGVLSALLKAVDSPDDEVADAISTQLVELGGARLRRGNWQASLASQLVSNDLVYALANALAKPRALAELPGIDDPQRAEQVVEKTAVLQFMITDETEALQKALPRLDQIIREQQGATASAPPVRGRRPARGCGCLRVASARP